jgi:hypothetical protein
VAATALLASTPFFLELHMGQFTFLAVALAVASLIALGDDPDPASPAGLLGAAGLAAAVNLKVFPLVTAPALLRSRAGRMAILGAAVSFAALNLPAFVAHPDQWRSFYEQNFVQPIGGLDSGNHGLLYVVYLAVRDLGGRWTPAAWRETTALWQLAVLGGTAWLAFLSRHRERVLLGGAALLLAHFLSYVHVWEHHASGVVPAALLVLLALARAPEQNRPSIAVLLAALALLVLPTTFALQDRLRDPRVWDPTGGWPPWGRYLPPLCKAVPTVAAFAVAISALARAGLSLPGAPRMWGRRPDAPIARGGSPGSQSG